MLHWAHRYATAHEMLRLPSRVLDTAETLDDSAVPAAALARPVLSIHGQTAFGVRCHLREKFHELACARENQRDGRLAKR